MGLALLGLAFLVALGLCLYLAMGLMGRRVVPGPAAAGQPGPTSQGWTGESRVTILVMGVDAREDTPGEGPGRSDTMMLISVDPVGLTAGMLSIPRDLWVNIPGFGDDKINMAYFDAEAYQLPGGGPALAMETVQNLLGIPVNYYGVVDFSSFTTLIDDIGGIDVNVPERELKIHAIYKGGTYDYLLKQGMNHLNGMQALAYARDRDTPGGDFDRARRQQQVIHAIRDKVLKPNMLPTLVARAPEFYRALASGLQTNLTLNQMIALAWTARDIPTQNIASGIIGPDQLQSMTTMNGLDVLVPDLSKVRELSNQVLFASGAPVPPEPTISPATLAPKEGAQIELVNGSGVSGLASATKDYLVQHGFSADKISLANAPVLYPSTQIIDFRGMPYTVEFLTELMHISPSNVLSQAPLEQGVDVEIILGADWQVPQN
ncbi:MAG: LCP family protein [Anaerolineales bacterium]|jgi:LCP family protein required for cell wall assembly